MTQVQEDLVTRIIRETKEQIAAQGGPRKAIDGCCAAAEAPIDYSKVQLVSKPKQVPPNAAALQAAANALGIHYTGPKVPANEPQVRLPRQQPRGPRVERPVPGVNHPVLNQPNTMLRYSRRALERLIRADLVARGNNMEVQVGFDEMGAFVTPV